MFPCTSCGLCCQNISKVKELKDFDLGNGVCIHFDPINNGCKIKGVKHLLGNKT